jgi:putative ABC transport system ATP-binding protein
MLYDMSVELSAEEQRQRAREALTSVGLEKRFEHHPNQLSGGQQQRVAIARALINRPPLILADEPTGNLDSKSSVEIMDLLHNLHESGVTIVMVTHESDIARHAGRTICVRDGQTVDGGHCL